MGKPISKNRSEAISPPVCSTLIPSVRVIFSRTASPSLTGVIFQLLFSFVVVCAYVKHADIEFIAAVILIVFKRICFFRICGKIDIVALCFYFCFDFGKKLGISFERSFRFFLALTELFSIVRENDPLF